jgi:hypothetical protein
LPVWCTGTEFFSLVTLMHVSEQGILVPLTKCCGSETFYYGSG